MRMIRLDVNPVGIIIIESDIPSSLMDAKAANLIEDIVDCSNGTQSVCDDATLPSNISSSCKWGWPQIDSDREVSFTTLKRLLALIVVLPASFEVSNTM